MSRRFPSLPVAKPDLGEAECEAVARPILSGWVTQGREVEAFEQEFAAYVGAKHACAVSSCTAALHLALLAVGVLPGDEVITVSHSFIATANAVRYCSAVPVFVDIQSETFNMDPALVEKAINEKTRAILCVHQLGMPCDLKAILDIAHRHALPVVEDAACAIGSEILWQSRWEKIGKPHGDIACFSFHPRKVLTTGDGGMITTSHNEYGAMFRLGRQHGMSVTDATRHESKEVVFESYATLGYNYRMTDIQAAIGRQQLKRLPEMLKRRVFLANRYTKILAKIPGLKLPRQPSWARSNWQSYCVQLPEGVDQRRVMQAMLDAGVTTRRGVMCAHREPVYAKEPWSCGGNHSGRDCSAANCTSLRESEKAQDHGIILPLMHQMTDADQDRVGKVLQDCCASSIAQ